MKHLNLCFLLASLSFVTQAQIEFERAYYITNDGERVEGLIRNVDWSSNPTSFLFKRSGSAVEERLEIEDAVAFGIHGGSKFVRFAVEMDQSSNRAGELSDQKAPEFEELQLFLRALIEGDASLYVYTDGDIFRYFYTVGEGDIEQLIHKKFIREDKTVGVNERYKQQLWNSLKCSEIDMQQIENTDYKRSELLKLFVNYNECKDSNFNLYQRAKATSFDLYLRLGVRSAKMNVVNDFYHLDENFGPETGFIAGILGEFVLPFNKNKWSITLEPTWHLFESSTGAEPDISEVTYNSLELPFGLRYYAFLSDKTSVFISPRIIGDVVLDAKISLADPNEVLDPNLDLIEQTGINFSIGAGFNYDKKLEMQVNYQTNRDLLSKYAGDWEAPYDAFELIVGYRIL